MQEVYLSDCEMSDYSSSPQRFAVINGDDFGFSTGVNRAIIKAHTDGVLTSTSLMVTGAAFEEAVALAKSHPNLGVGLHLVLVCGNSALPAHKVPHLVDQNGCFSNNPAWAGLRYQFSSAARRELRAEIRSQLETFRQTGLPLAHVDGHLHLHSHPVVLNLLIELAAEFDIQTIRLPFEELNFTLQADPSHPFAKALGGWIFNQLRRYGERRLKRANIQFAERVYGLLQSGQMTEAYLAKLIPQIQANRIEIYSHPAIAVPGEPENGPTGSGEKELAALLSAKVKNALSAQGFTLTHYRNLSLNPQPLKTIP